MPSQLEEQAGRGTRRGAGGRVSLLQLAHAGGVTPNTRGGGDPPTHAEMLSLREEEPSWDQGPVRAHRRGHLDPAEAPRRALPDCLYSASHSELLGPPPCKESSHLSEHVRL